MSFNLSVHAFENWISDVERLEESNESRASRHAISTMYIVYLPDLTYSKLEVQITRSYDGRKGQKNPQKSNFEATLGSRDRR